MIVITLKKILKQKPREPKKGGYLKNTSKANIHIQSQAGIKSREATVSEASKMHVKEGKQQRQKSVIEAHLKSLYLKVV